MLRRTQPQHFFTWQKGVSRAGGGWVPHNKDINRIIISMKERGKSSAYYGTYMMRNPDREMWWNGYSNPRTARFYLKRTFSPKQFHHYNTFHDRYALHIVQKSPHQGIGGGIFRCIWDNTIGFTNSSFCCLKWSMKNCDRDAAIHTLETFGIKTILIDDRRAPRPGDFHAIKHALYSHNFPWVKDPGDEPDWHWKGLDKYDYSSYGANTKCAQNVHQSLWLTENGGAVGSEAATVVAALAPPSEAQAAPEKKKKKATPPTTTEATTTAATPAKEEASPASESQKPAEAA